MRLRLMATYLGVPYQAGLGPDGTDVTLFSPGPPPEELGFTAVDGHWRKQLRVTDLDALWQSRPVGDYRGEPCLVLDDPGGRLHIAYLGRDTTRAIQLGYWEIDREVFEVVVARQDVTGLTEERVEFPLAAAMFPPSGDAAEVPSSGAAGLGATGLGATAPFAGPAAGAEPAAQTGTGPASVNGTGHPDRPVEAEGARDAFEPAGLADSQNGTAGPGMGDHASRAPDRVAAWHGSPWPEPWPEPEPEPWPEEPSSWDEPGSWTEPGSWAEPGSWTGLEPWDKPEDRAEAVTARPPARRGAGKDRVSPQSAFAELLRLAAISQSAYAVNEEVPGAMCLVKADGGFEVFSCTEDARLEVRFFEDEEAAYFYLFGVLAAEAIRSGRLGPRGLRGPGRANGRANGSGGTGRSPASTENVSKRLQSKKLPE
jgi:hypothetical protein